MVLAALDAGDSGLVGVGREGYRLLRLLELFAAGSYDLAEGDLRVGSLCHPGNPRSYGA